MTGNNPTFSTSIGRHLLKRMLILNIVLTLVFTSIQALIDYNGQVTSIQSHLKELQSAQVGGISAALWSFDKQTLSAQLEGILHFPHITYVAVTSKDGLFLEVGKKTTDNFIDRQIQMTQEYNGRQVSIGTLYFQANTATILAEVLNRVVSECFVLLLIVTLVSLFLFLLFNRLVTRHLTKAAEHFYNVDLNGVSQPLQLDKKISHDEIDVLVDSFNTMQEKLVGVYGQLREREQTLRQSEQRLHLATVSARLGVWDWDITNNVLTWDDRMFELYGLSRDLFAGCIEAWENGLHPEDRPLARAAIAAALSGEKDYDLEFRVVQPDGTVREIKADGLVIRDETGAAVRMIGLNRDITLQKQAEKALIAAESQYRNLLESVELLAVMLNGEGNITFCNDYLLNLTGWSREEVFGRNWFELFIPEEERTVVKSVFSANVSIQNILHFENTIITKDKRKLLVAWNNSPLKDMEGNYVGAASIGTNLTEYRRVEEQLRQAQKMESVGRLAGGVAHDFNNMLSVILGHAELGLMNLDPTNPVCADLQEIKNSAERSAELTRQLLAFARKQTVMPKVINLNDTVTSMLKMLQRLIGEDIHLTWQPSPDQCHVKVDPSQLDQILANLCVNARDAIADIGRITIETGTCTIDPDYCTANPEATPGDYVRLVVSDDGKGMDRETQTRIFEPFYSTKEMGKGTGLGLATVYGAVKQNNGFITIYSEPGKGTTFSIYLPRYAGDSARKQTEDTALPVPQGQETILLVEDETGILNTTAIMLEKQGYTVLRAYSPGRAMELAREHHGAIHLLMTDVIMPEMNGRDLARNILSLHSGMKRLFMSGYTADVIAHHGVLDEGVHFIQKPFALPKMAAKVREVLDSN